MSFMSNIIVLLIFVRMFGFRFITCLETIRISGEVVHPNLISLKIGFADKQTRRTTKLL